MDGQLRLAARYKILVVEDEEELRWALVHSLKMHFGDALEVSEASGANAAIRMLQTGRYSFVVSDLNMPDGHGVQLGAYLDRLQSTPFFLFFSTTSDLAVPFRNENFLGLVQKPNIEKVMKIVGEYLCLEG